MTPEGLSDSFDTVRTQYETVSCALDDAADARSKRCAAERPERNRMPVREGPVMVGSVAYALLTAADLQVSLASKCHAERLVHGNVEFLDTPDRGGYGRHAQVDLATRGVRPGREEDTLRTCRSMGLRAC